MVMNNEIKEILDKLKDGNWYDELDLTGTMWIELRWEETHLLLDYISNLEEDRESYREMRDKLIEDYTEEIQRNINLKTKINTAIEWIKEDYDGGYFECSESDIMELLKILEEK